MLIVLIFNNFKGDSLLEDIIYLDDDNSDFSVSNATNEETIDIK